jgi:hypothetical protein
MGTANGCSRSMVVSAMENGANENDSFFRFQPEK